jgi:hypothetical protein
VAVGALGTLLVEHIGYTQQREDALDDRLYQERSTAYIRFLEAAHECAHEIGKLARHDEHGGEDVLTREERVAISYNVDAFVAKHVRAVEIVGPESVESAAKAILRSLYAFRNELADARAAGRPVAYRFEPDSPYMALLNEYRDDREAFVEAAKNELARLSKRSDQA